MAYKINEQNRLNMRTKIINGAKKYANDLVNKDFMVICEDGSIHSVRFFKKDFQHLTGLLSDLSENDFFTRCMNGTISVQNILEDQKYNIATLKDKTRKIEQINEIVYGNTANSLFMVNLHTNTADYPVAIRNKDISMCVGFREKSNRARTLRKYANSGKADDQLEIIAIFAKTMGTELYTEKVYLKDAETLFNTASNVVEKLTDDVKQDLTPAQEDVVVDIVEEVAVTIEETTEDTEE